MKNKNSTCKVYCFILVATLLCLSTTAYSSSERNVALVKDSNSFYGAPTEQEFSDFISNNTNYKEYKEFRKFLQENEVDGVIPIQHLCRQGTDWSRLNTEPYAIPPQQHWHNILPTLKFIKNELIPIVGDIQVVSGYRTKEYNKHAHGAKRSKHLQFNAVDLVPVNYISREELHKILLSIWGKVGRKYNLGLGLYTKTRFHIDTARFRKW